MDTDLALLQEWRNGSKSAGSELFRRHFASVFRFFHNKVGDVGEDLTQQTFAGIVEGRDRIRGESSFRTYLFAVARNQLLMHLRKTYRRRDRIDPGSWSMVDARGSALRRTIAGEQHRLLHAAMQRIPIDYQIALEMFYWEDLSVNEIAGVLEVPSGTIKSRLSRGRKLLEVELAKQDGSAQLVQSTIDGFDRWMRSLPGAIKREAATG